MADSLDGRSGLGETTCSGEFSSKSGMRCEISHLAQKVHNPSRDPSRTLRITGKYEKTCRHLVPAEQECVFLNSSLVIPAGAEFDVAVTPRRNKCICRSDQALTVESRASALGELIDLCCLSNRPFCHFCLSCRFTGRRAQPVRPTSFPDFPDASIEISNCSYYGHAWFCIFR